MYTAVSRRRGLGEAAAAWLSAQHSDCKRYLYAMYSTLRVSDDDDDGSSLCTRNSHEARPCRALSLVQFAHFDYASAPVDGCQIPMPDPL